MVNSKLIILIILIINLISCSRYTNKKENVEKLLIENYSMNHFNILPKMEIIQYHRKDSELYFMVIYKTENNEIKKWYELNKKILDKFKIKESNDLTNYNYIENEKNVTIVMNKDFKQVLICFFNITN